MSVVSSTAQQNHAISLPRAAERGADRTSSPLLPLASLTGGPLLLRACATAMWAPMLGIALPTPRNKPPQNSRRHRDRSCWDLVNNLGPQTIKFVALRLFPLYFPPRSHLVFSLLDQESGGVDRSWPLLTGAAN
jgi:hypothetical protein